MMRLKQVKMINQSFAIIVVLCVSTVAYGTNIEQERCAAFRSIQEKLNADTGAMLDAYTRHDGMAVLCATKVVDYKKTLLLPFSALEDGWQERKKKQWNAIFCENLPMREAIMDGWTISETLISAEGERFYTAAVCDQR